MPTRPTRVRRARLALGLVPLLAGPLAAQSAPVVERPTGDSYFRRTIDREQGLPETQVNAITQTPDGYLWLGTRRGLVRYDGLTFTTFSPANTKAIPAYWINGVSVDRRGRLWVSTTGGLTVKEDSGFRRIPAAEVSAAAWDVLEDRRGRIWVATQEGVLVGDGERFHRVPGATSYTYALTQDSLGRIWMAGREFLGLSSGDSVVNLARMFPDARRFFDVMVDGPDRVWVATRQGAIRLSLDAKGTPKIAHTVSTRAGLEERAVWSLGRTPDGAIWLGTATSGTMMWDGTVLHSLASDARESWAMTTDRRGVLWVGTAAGLERYQRRAFANLNAGLPKRSMWSVRIDERGTIWAALANGSLYRWSGTRFVEAVRGVGTTVSTPIWPVPGGMLIAPRGPPELLPAGGRVPRRVRAEGLPPGETYGMLRDSGGAIWMSVDSGLFRVKDGKAVHMNPLLGIARTESPRDMVIDANGRLLLGDPGLTVIEHDEVRHYGLAEGLSGSPVNSVYPRGNKVWIGTADSGLFVLNRGRIMSLGDFDARLKQEVIAFAADNLGYLWLIGRYGLSRVVLEELEEVADGLRANVAVQGFDASDGLGLASFEMDYQRAIVKDRSGRLWLPGTDGVLLVDPRRVLTDSTPPQTHVESVVVDGTSRTLNKELALAAGVGRVEITFAATNVAYPRRVRVQYRMLGLDSTWSDAGLRRTASFGPLRGGDYRFEIRAASEAGFWGATSSLVMLRVARTLPEHGWFLPALVLLTAGIVVIIARSRQRSLALRGRELAGLVDERTRELEASRASLERRVEERTAQLTQELAARALLEHELVQAQKLEGLGRLAGGVAHEINNSMMGVLGFAEMAASAAEGRDDILSELKEVRRAGERVAAITRQLLTFARRQHSARALLDLGELVTQMERMLQQTAGERIRIEVVVEDGLRPMRADRAQLEQVILNLVLNARDAMPDDGVVTVRVSSRAVAAVQSVGGVELAPGTYQLLEVTDTGTGIPEDVRLRLFEPFFTTKESNRGSGMGLAVCHGIAVQHSGAIDVRSAPERGTTFEVWLPVGLEDAPAIAADQLRADSGGGGETVLLVDDEPIVREIARRILLARGYHVLVAGGGADALDLAGLEVADIDLVLTDVVMPEVSGLQLAKALRDRRSDVPLIFMSGFVGHGGTEEEELARLGPMMTKPFTGDAMATLVRSELDRGRRSKRMPA